MQELKYNIIPEYHKDTILSCIQGHLTVLQFSIGKLYLAKFDSDFVDIDMEGVLALIFNRKSNSIELQHYDYKSCKLQMEMTLYINLATKRGYTVIQDCFHAIQTSFGFLGINFLTKFMAQKMKKAIISSSKILQFIHKKSKNNPVNFITPSTEISHLPLTKKYLEAKRLENLSIVKKSDPDKLLANFGFAFGEINNTVSILSFADFSCRIGNPNVLSLFFNKIRAQALKENKEGSLKNNNKYCPAFVNFDEEKRLTLIGGLTNKENLTDNLKLSTNLGLLLKKGINEGNNSIIDKALSLKHLSHLNFRKRYYQKKKTIKETNESDLKQSSTKGLNHVKFKDDIPINPQNRRFKGSVAFVEVLKVNQEESAPEISVNQNIEKQLNNGEITLRDLQQAPEFSENPMLAEIKQAALKLKPAIKKSLKINTNNVILDQGMRFALEQLANSRKNISKDNEDQEDQGDSFD